ncbi:hypothetical protein ACLOJK_025390 [Asimina triloba]
MNLRKGYNVWVEDRDCAWVSTTAAKLLPRDPDADHAGVDDMTKLTYLHEPGVLYNLGRRYALNDIYVRGFRIVDGFRNTYSDYSSCNGLCFNLTCQYLKNPAKQRDRIPGSAVSGSGPTELRRDLSSEFAMQINSQEAVSFGWSN